MEIGDSRVEAPPDHRFRNIMATLSHPLRYSGHRQIFARQLEKEQGHLIASLSPLPDHPRIDPPVEGGLDGETFFSSHTIRDHLQHQSGSANRRLFRAEGRESLRDQIRIDESQTVSLSWQKLSGKRRLASAIRSGDGDDGLIRVHGLSKFSQPLQRLQDFRDLLGAFGGLSAELGGEDFGVGAVSGEEFLDGGDLGGESGGPGDG